VDGPTKLRRKGLGLDCDFGRRTNLEPDNDRGGASTIPLPEFLILFGRNLDGIMRTMASLTLLYHLTVSSPKPKNIKEITVDTGIGHQISNAIQRSCGLIIAQG